MITRLKEKWNLCNKWQKRLLRFSTIILIVAGILIAASVTEEELSFRVEYYKGKGYTNDFWVQLFADTGAGYSEESSSYQWVEHNHVVLPITGTVESIQSLRLDPMNQEATAKISSVQVLNHGVIVKRIPLRDILEKAEFQNVAEPSIELSMLRINAEGDDPHLKFNREFVQEYFGYANLSYKLQMCIWAVGIYLIVACLICYGEKVKKAVEYLYLHFDTIMRVALAAAAFMVMFMAFKSHDYAHPDENVSKGAVEYYVEHWAPGDIRSPEAADSFSEYGFSRLSETTVYYFLAGKVAWIGKYVFGILKYYRLFNVSLFLGLVALCFWKGKTNRYLYILTTMTPQVWYIFSYCTSDAWDYFISVIIMYQILNRESVLNKTLHEKLYKWKVPGLVMAGVLFGILGCGKANYLAVAAVVVLMLADKIFRADKEQRRQLFLRYLTILLIWYVYTIGASMIQAIQYDSDFSEVSAQMRQQYAWDEYKPDENGNRGYEYLDLKSKGVTLTQLFEEYEFAKKSSQSYMGCYGWVEYPGSDAYYFLMQTCYVAIAILWLVRVIRNRSEAKGYLLLALINCLVPVMFGVSVWHAWTSDFQAQGRYWLPCNAVFARNEREIREEDMSVKWIGAFQVMLVLLGLFSLWYYGICALT